MDCKVLAGPLRHVVLWFTSVFNGDAELEELGTTVGESGRCAPALSPTLAASDVADCEPINDSTSRGDLAAQTCGNGVCSISCAGSDGGKSGTNVADEVDPCGTLTWAAGCESLAGVFAGGDGERGGDRGGEKLAAPLEVGE